jgi:RIP metalloprotease RseP
MSVVSILNTLSTIAIFLIVLGLIVLVHEFGHFIAARLTGVRVEIFSFGFGKRLLGKKVGDTDFRLSLIPLGGYVKMAGEEEYDPNDLKPYEFHAKNRAQKIFILVMGPVMNLFLAFFIFTIMHIVGVEEPVYKKEPPQIGFVEKGSAAEAAGIRKGDLIRTIDGSSIKNWGELELTIGTNPDVEIIVKFERGGKLIKKKLNVKSISKYSFGDAGIYWDFKSQFTGIIKDSPADKSGLKPGDILLAIDNTPVHHLEMIDEIARSANRPLLLQIKRGEEKREIKVVPRKVYSLESQLFDSIEIANQNLKGLREAFPTFDFNLFRKYSKYIIISRNLETREEAEKYPGSIRFNLSMNSKMRNFFCQKILFKNHILEKTPFPILFRCMFSCIRPISIYFDIVLRQPGLLCTLTVKEKGVIGVEREAYSPSITTSYGFFPAMKKSVDKIGGLTFLVFNVFKKMIVGRLSFKTMSGPIEIAKFSKKALESGLPNFFLLIAFISLQLGIINLFPIPALDGGHLMVFSIEAVIRREFSQKVKGILMNIGFFIIIALMVFVILNDLAKAGIISLPF